MIYHTKVSNFIIQTIDKSINDHLTELSQLLKIDIISEFMSLKVKLFNSLSQLIQMHQQQVV
jgi:hypothetical protein